MLRFPAILRDVVPYLGGLALPPRIGRTKAGSKLYPYGMKLGTALTVLVSV